MSAKCPEADVLAVMRQGFWRLRMNGCHQADVRIQRTQMTRKQRSTCNDVGASSFVMTLYLNSRRISFDAVAHTG